ncbi:gluconokinase [Nocardia sp. BMG51109]|uniref:gluconokinase n=1 Tax=Nocardia sp. BMG51109 TaxID=1056816 RepID=UPI0004667228|nr:gluconokinase [Nocardia sp. BMG51109]
MSSGRRPYLVVMGVTGCGKTTIARRVADLLSLEFLDADSLHPQSNIDKMTAGTPLTDADRAPWLEAVRAAMRSRGSGCVVACSALRRWYRDVLRDVPEPVAFVHLDGDPATIRSRISSRSGHFMQPALLDSQLDLLEPLEPDEPGIVLDISHAPDEIARAAVEFARTCRTGERRGHTGDDQL